jgi:hypothetical protein
MDFSESNPTVPQADPRTAFHLPPVALATSAEVDQIADAATGDLGGAKSVSYPVPDPAVSPAGAFLRVAGL